MAELITFKSFYTLEEAETVSAFLTEKRILNRITRQGLVLDKVIGGDDIANEFLLQLNENDFTKANQLLDELIRANISTVGEDYYLYSFTREELLDIVHKPDEWSNQDVIIARKILEDKGIAFDERKMNDIRSERNQELAIPEKVKSSTLAIAYLSALIFSPVGLIMGLIYLTTKNRLPDGKKVFAFDEHTRAHGRNLCIIGVIVILFVFGMSIYTNLLSF